MCLRSKHHAGVGEISVSLLQGRGGGGVLFSDNIIFYEKIPDFYLDEVPAVAVPAGPLTRPGCSPPGRALPSPCSLGLHTQI